MMYIVIWCAYGDWKATSPFMTQREAEDHIKRYLATPDKDYNKHITIIPVEIPQ